MIGGGTVTAIFTDNVQNTSMTLDEQGEGVTVAARTAGVIITDIAIVESGEEAGVVSVCTVVVGVGEIVLSRAAALTVCEGEISDGISSVHGRYTCVVILTISLSVQIKSVVLG